MNPASPSTDASAADVIGCVEQLSGSTLSGWALSRSGAAVRMALSAGDQNIELVWLPVERADVAEAHGPNGLFSGFSANLTQDELLQLQRARLQGRAVTLVVNGVAVGEVPEPQAAAPEPAAAPLVRPEEPAVPALVPARMGTPGHVDDCRRFMLLGWTAINGVAGTVSLVCNGKALRATVVRSSRPDVLDSAGQRVADAGFTIDLPGSIWRGVPPMGECELQVMVEGKPLDPSPVTLNRATTARWVREVVALPEGLPEKSHLLLVALEHVAAGRMLDVLDAATRESLLAHARELKLDDAFLHAGGSRPVEADSSESLDTLLLWEAMRELNGRLAGQPASAVAEVIATLRAHPLTQLSRDWYNNLAIQVACESNELEKLRELIDFSRLHPLVQSDDTATLTLIVPILVCDGRVDLATNVLRRVAGLRGGWAQTGCLHYAVQRVLAAEREGTVHPDSAERFRDAFLALLETMTGDWFSRLQDLALIDATLDILAAQQQFSDYQRRDIERATLRYYGLCPTFWSRAHAIGAIPADGTLAIAHRHWLAYREALESFRATPRLQPATVEALEWYLALGSVEAPVALREMVMNGIHRLGTAADASLDALARLLARHVADERLRLAAAPVLRGSAQADAAVPLASFIRERTDGTISWRFNLQREAVALALELRRTLRDAREVDPALLEQLEQKAALLSEERSLHFGVDLLAAALGLLLAHGRPAQKLLTRLREFLLRAVRTTPETSQLPPAIYSAFARLQALRDDRFARAVVEEAARAIEQRLPRAFAPIAASLPPAGPTELPIAGFVLDNTDWLGDTLVLVPLPDAAAAGQAARIRASWAAELADIGMRVLFVREGSIDAVSGDTLTLALPSDAGPAELHMRMLAWANRQAVAYVLVIPSNVFLSVPRLAEAAAYRKHHYAGRIISRADIQLPRGGIDANGELVLEKSPEDSRFVDDGLGLTLSRHALAQLLAMAATPQGQRLRGTALLPGKLIGDLLAMAGIEPTNEDYLCHRRLVTPGCLPVAQRDNLFLPGPDTPTLLVTAGDDEDFAGIAAAATRPGLLPHKIWPCMKKPQLGRNTNQLELLSPVSRLDVVNAAETVVVAVMRNEMAILDRFLAHYRKLGAGAFIIVDNCSDDGTREHLLQQPDVLVYSADTEYRHSHYGVAWQYAVLGNHCIGKWVVLADADEFLVYPGSERIPLARWTRSLDEADADAALVLMIDMYPYDDLDAADFTRDEPFQAAAWFDRQPLIELMFGGGQFSNSRNFVNGLRHRIAPSRINAYVSQKYAVFRYWPWMRLSEGIHYTANMRVAAEPAYFAHFKYHTGFKAKVMTEISRKQHYNGAEEYRRYAAMLAEGSGAFGREGLSVRYRDSSSFVAIGNDLDRSKSK